MSKYFKIKGYWKDTKEEFEDLIVKEFEDVEENDEEIFFYGLNNQNLKEAINVGEDTAFDFIITHYKEISMNYTPEKKDEIERILINKWTKIGMDIPNNFESIVQSCYEDVCETAHPRNWSDGDVSIAFRRWIEEQDVIREELLKAKTNISESTTISESVEDEKKEIIIDKINAIIEKYGEFNIYDVEADHSPFLNSAGTFTDLMEGFSTHGGKVNIYDPRSHNTEQIDTYDADYYDLDLSQLKYVLTLAEKWEELKGED